MKKTIPQPVGPALGRASRITRGANGHMLEASGLWGMTGLNRD
ncbi:hypothetical protein ABDK56_09600 [Sphingomonas sp. ASV193]